MTRLFRVQYGTSRPVEVEAETPTYPNRDSDGQTIYDNTHFIDRAQAWDCCVREHLASVSLDSAKVEDLRRQLAAAEKRLADSAILYTQALANQADEVKA